jgi:hypothetical protein
VPLDRVAAPALGAVADGIAAHLLTHRWPDETPVGMLGSYRSAAGEYRPLVAPPLEQALTALALYRYAASPDTDGAMAEPARALADRLLHDLQDVTPAEPDPCAVPATCAAIILAGLETDPPSAPALLARARERLVLLIDPAVTVSTHDLALAAAAGAALFRAGAAGVEQEAIRARIDRAWDSAEAGGRVQLLPWIVRAELDYAVATDEPIAHSGALRDLAGAARASQSTAETDPDGPDVHGGFRLRTSRGERIDAQSLRIAAGLAALARVEDDPAARHALRAALRYAMQLAVRPDGEWAHARPERARGGIRGATWSGDLPVAAQAIGLLAVLEAREALE